MVSTTTMVALGAAALFDFCLPLGAYLICRGRMKVRPRNILVGSICFLSAVALEALLGRRVATATPQIASWFKAHDLARALYPALLAGVFEETGRLFGMSFLVRKEDGAGVAYGIGHGGIEAILAGGLISTANLVLALLVNHGELGPVLGNSLPPTAVTTLVHLTWHAPLLKALERASAFVFQIALSLLVWRAVTKKRPLLFVAAILAHFGIDAPGAMVDLKVIHIEAWMLDGTYAAIAIAILAILLPRLPGKSP